MKKNPKLDSAVINEYNSSFFISALQLVSKIDKLHIKRISNLLAKIHEQRGIVVLSKKKYNNERKRK